MGVDTFLFTSWSSIKCKQITIVTASLCNASPSLDVILIYPILSLIF